MSQQLLLTPGPSEVPPRVLARIAQPLVHHRTKDFQAVLARVHENLRKVFLTQHPVMSFACSGTGAMEASITNCLSPGDTVLSFSSGKWGERYRDIAKVYGLEVHSFEKPYGQAVSPEEVRSALKKYPQVKGVLVALCETSTGVLHPVEAIAKETRESGALLIVDAISGLLCDPLKMDAWGVDVVVCGSQKGFMLPPGLGFVALGDRAITAVQKSRFPKYYFHFEETLKALKKNDTPFTPAVSLIQGLDEALTMALDEGLENVWKRHNAMAALVRQNVTDWGLEIFSKAHSAALTAVKSPAGIDSGAIIQEVKNIDNVIMADGQNELKGRIFRFAHMGAAATPQAVERGLKALSAALEKTGYKPKGSLCLHRS